MINKLTLGSYTRKTSQGIYTIDLDTKNKQLTHLTPLIKEDNPTYLAISENRTIYSVAKADDLGGVAAYKKLVDGTFELVNRVMEVSAPPCYIALDKDRHLLFGANYHQGIVTSYLIQEDGSLSLADRIQHTGSGPHDNQNGPHAHYSDLTPDKRLAVCDLGNDTVYTYNVSPKGKLTEVATFKANPGTGPRHLVFHPNNQLAYLFGELSSEIIVLSYDEANGSFKELQVVSTLPDNYTDFNGGAAIRLSNDGRFLYASNRGHNSIAVFKVVKDGKHIERIQLISVEGDFPRDFDLSPDNHFLIVANQNTDNLSLYDRDSETGMLTLCQKDIFAPEIVCVTFK